MAFFVALLITGITAVSVGLFWARIWWFPVNISAHGGRIDNQMIVTMISCGIIFVLAQLGLAFLIWWRRSSAARARVAYSRGNDKLEVTWTVATAIFFIGLGVMSKDIWADIQYTEAPAGSLKIEVTGQQFAWNFRYAGPDGAFGPRHLELVDDAAANPLGLDYENDPDSQDDIVVPTIAVPVNRSVELILRSKDVLHAFWVRELRLKQDLVPGLDIRSHFTATQVGKYEITCAELCGLGHHKMRSFLEVMSQENFENWLEARAAEQ